MTIDAIGTLSLEDISCRANEKIVDCISRAYDYSLLHVPLLDKDKVIGLIDFYRLAGILSLVKDRFPSILCKDVSSFISSPIMVDYSKLNNMEILLPMLTSKKYTSIGIVKEKEFRGTLTASSLAQYLVSMHVKDDVSIREVYSRRIGIISNNFMLTDILRIIARRRQPCLIVFDGFDVAGVVCLSDVLYLLAQFETKPPIDRMYADEFVKEPTVVDAETRLNDYNSLRGYSEPLIVLDEGEISGMFSALEVLEYMQKQLQSKYGLKV